MVTFTVGAHVFVDPFVPFSLSGAYRASAIFNRTIYGRSLVIESSAETGAFKGGSIHE
jgi:hypothetical protein